MKETRKARGITQGEIAAHLNLDVSAISLCESGRRNISVALLEKWLGFFHLKYIIVNEKQNELQESPIKEEIARFQKLKKRRNELIYLRHSKQAEILKEIFPNMCFIGNHKMECIGMIDEGEIVDDLQEYDVLAYYNSVVVLERVNTIEDFISSLHLPTYDIHLKDKLGKYDEVIMRVDDGIYSAENAMGFTIKSLVKIESYFKTYMEVILMIEKQLQASINELEIINQKIQNLVEKWRYSEDEEHPNFEEWSPSDIESVCYADFNIKNDEVDLES